jgi:site-specific DNA-methyltransferase (adenine-specific)
MGKFILGDCMDKNIGLPSYPDGFFDLAIVDPPYGEHCNLVGGTSANGGAGWKGTYGKAQKWNTEPSKAYFLELFRVSKNQIIWGANYFIEKISKNSSGWIFWDKGQRNFTLADGELAWTSFKKPLRVANYSRGKLNSERVFHPTEKPIALYEWILSKYAKPGDLILDTHVGSASSLIAYEGMGFDYIGFEIDPDYYAAAKNRMSKGIQSVLKYD